MKVVLENLTKYFPNRKKGENGVIAVNNFSFEIPDGKLIGLLGPSGCGKSTTLYMLSGLLKPTKGKIYFDGEDVTMLAPEKRGIGLVFQNYALYPHMTVRKNILFPLENLKIPKEERDGKVLASAKLVQIDELLDRKPSELSGGQQQRVAIARAMVKSPNVLLLDEPLSNLDARLRLQTREEIKRIQQETKVTTIFVTHDQEEAMSISDYIVVMEKGVVQQIDKPQLIYNNPENLFVAKFLGTPPINVFTGYIKNGKVFIGSEEPQKDEFGKNIKEANSEEIMSVKAKDQKVYIGIRPEGFIPSKTGCLTVKLDHVEVMGRDISIISSHPYAIKPTIRSIVDSDIEIDTKSENVKFNLKPHKVFLFNYDTELRINYVPTDTAQKIIAKPLTEDDLLSEDDKDGR